MSTPTPYSEVGVNAWPMSMATTDIAPNVLRDLRLPQGSLAEELFNRPWKFDFFQAVMILQDFASGNAEQPSARIGRFEQPSMESMRFTAPYSTSFPTATIPSIHWDADQKRASVEVNFLGLTGPSGILPPPYNERLHQIYLSRKHPERDALRDWLDNFNHRAVSLFFEAWAKYRFPVTIRQNTRVESLKKTEPTLFHVALASIAGLDSRVVRNNEVTIESSDLDQSVPAPKVERDELLGLAGMLAQRPMNVANLTSALTTCLNVPVKVVQFEGCWLNLEEETQCQLGVANHELGRNATLGDRIWNRQQRILIEVGPVSETDFKRFTPPSETHAADGYCRLRDLVRILVGPTLQFDVCPILRIDGPIATTVSVNDSGNRLGIDSWLGAPIDAMTANDAVFAGC